MNFIRSPAAIGNFMGQWRRRLVETGGRRGMCIKPHEGKPEAPPAAVPKPGPHLGFKLPGYKPSNMDKKILIWSGRFKTVDQIPELVSFEMLDAARNRVRVKACYGMMIATIASCLMMVFLGKQAAKRHESLTSQNMEKKARWRQEVLREKEAAAAAAALAEKAQ